jgi:signal transduction histidine kinase
MSPPPAPTRPAPVDATADGTEASPPAPTGPGRSAGAPGAAWATLVLSIVPAVGAVGLAVALRPPWDLTMWFAAVDVTVAVVYGVVAWVMLSRLRHAVAWCFALAALGGGAAAFAALYGLLWEQHPDLWAASWIVPAVGTAWLPGTLSLVVVVPWLVRGGATPTPVRVAVAAGWAVIAAIVVCRATNPLPWPDGDPFMPFAIRSEAWAHLTADALPWLFAALVVLGLAAAVEVAWRWRRGPEAERLGLGWLAIGATLMAVSFVPLTFPQGWFEGSVAVSTFTPVTMLVAQAFLPAAALVAILRQQMWSIDLAVSRALVWTLLTGGLVATYALVVVLVGRFVGSEGLVAALAAVAVALAVSPLRARLQRSVDHLVHGTAGDPSRALRAMSREIGRAGSATGAGADGDDLLGSMVEGLRGSLRLAWVAVEGEDGRQRAAAGAPEGATVRVPLQLRGRTTGRLAISAPHGVRLDGRSRRTIDAMAPVLAAALAMADLSAGLRRAEARLTSARVEERRILRRDLHDGLGPALAGIGLGLQAYRNLRDRDPARADALLDVLADEVDRQAEGVRSLSRALLPPVLQELGLVPALEDLAARHRSGAVAVELRADVRGPVPEAVATAAYAIASEALVNAQRHAGAARVQIEVSTDGEALALSVADDGRGLDPGRTPGVGLRSMVERAEELGGRCTVQGATGGGVEVAVALPLGGARAVAP